MGNLSGLAVVSKNDIWAVGYTLTNPLQTLIEHWDGTRWFIVLSPNPSKGSNLLYGASAVSHNDVWVVGETISPTDLSTQALIEHWNGTTWSVIPSPNPPSATDSALEAVTARSRDDVWAVGSYTTPQKALSGRGPILTLIEHWNGKIWTIVPSANILLPDGDNYLQGVTALSATNVWAVGYFFNRLATTNLYYQPLIEHWNGKTWGIVSSPAPNVSNSPAIPPPGGSDLQAVTAISERDMWAVGYSVSPENGSTHTLIEHWNGMRWSIVSSPNALKGADSLLRGVAASSHNDVWAVGSLIEHWNGKTWSIVPNSSISLFNLFAVSALSSQNAWIVGNGDQQIFDQPLIEHWGGKIWSVE